jgi:hypothetical protein
MTRTADENAMREDETICYGCGRLVTHAIYSTVIPGTDAAEHEDPETGRSWWTQDPDHPTGGVAQYCESCFPLLRERGVKPGEHDRYDLQDPSDDEQSDDAGTNTIADDQARLTDTGVSR